MWQKVEITDRIDEKFLSRQCPVYGLIDFHCSFQWLIPGIPRLLPPSPWTASDGLDRLYSHVTLGADSKECLGSGAIVWVSGLCHFGVHNLILMKGMGKGL